jgi:hypothetical protein
VTACRPSMQGQIMQWSWSVKRQGISRRSFLSLSCLASSSVSKLDCSIGAPIISPYACAGIFAQLLSYICWSYSIYISSFVSSVEEFRRNCVLSCSLTIHKKHSTESGNFQRVPIWIHARHPQKLLVRRLLCAQYLINYASAQTRKYTANNCPEPHVRLRFAAVRASCHNGGLLLWVSIAR